MSNAEARIEQLEKQVAELQQKLDTSNQTMVNTIAAQIQHLFSDQVMVDSIAYRVMLAGANAIAHKVSHSKERAPELVVLEGYIPGAIRAAIHDDGSISIDQQLKGATNAASAWESATESFQKNGIAEQFAHLLAAYGAEVGRIYYITDTVTRDTYKEELAKSMAASQVGAAVDEPGDLIEEVDYLLITKPVAFGDSPAEGADLETAYSKDHLFSVVRADGQTLEGVAITDLQVGDVIVFERNGMVTKESVVSVARAIDDLPATEAGPDLIEEEDLDTGADADGGVDVEGEAAEAGLPAEEAEARA